MVTYYPAQGAGLWRSLSALLDELSYEGNFLLFTVGGLQESGYRLLLVAWWLAPHSHQ
jgi:hypothetical protein